MTSQPSQPPAPSNCGRRLLSHVIDERASSDHGRPFASIPCSSRPEEGYKDVPYSLFANSINRLAAWLLTEIGPPATDCESLVYIAPPDLRYQILIMAAVKAGYIAFLVSPRNSTEAFAALLAECGANNLVTTDPPSPAVPVMLKTRQMKSFIIPALAELLQEERVPKIPVTANWEDWRFRPFVQIHSSGSTGTPKLVTLKHGSFTALDGFQLLESNELAQRFGMMRNFVSFPPFHIAGITYSLASPVWVDSTAVLPPPSPLTAELVNAVHLEAGVECSLLPPSLVSDLASNPEYFRNMTNLNAVMFSGGPLPEAVGRQISAHTKLHAGYGASEWNAVPQRVKEREDWAWFYFNEKEGGLEFREQDNGLYEMVICRRKEYNLSQPVFVTLPHLDEFESRDLFSKHPSKPGLWKYASRLDDIIVFSNGEKFNPVTFEGTVSTSPAVKGCVVIGQGRFQPALLVEPRDAAADRNDLFESIWPYVQKVNESAVRHGRIVKDSIFLTKAEKPLPRAGKGTIQRAAANVLYAHEIDDLYASLETVQRGRATGAQNSHTLDLSTLDCTKSSLTRFINEDLGLEGIHDPDSDFFSLGMDSLQIVNIVRAINAVRPDNPIDAKQVYDHPSITQLAQSLQMKHEQTSKKYFDGEDSDDEELKESWLAMEQTFQDMTANMHAGDGKRNPKDKLRGLFEPSENGGPVFPPDGGKVAWLQVLAMFLVNINNWGLINSFGVFQAFYEVNLLRSHSASSIALIGTMQGTLLLLVGVISGPLFDKGYFKPTLVLSSLGLVFALMMLSLSTRYYQVMLTQGVLCGIFSGGLYIPSVALVPVYFKHHRGLALGLATGGGSIGGIIYPIIFRRLLEEVGFGWAVRVVGFLALLTLGTAIVLSKPINARSRRQLIDRSALLEKAYVFFLASAFLLLAAIFVPFFLATSYSIQRLHVDSSLSFYLIPIINAAQLLGRILPSWASDYRHNIFGPEVYQFTSEMIMAVLGLSWIAIDSTGGFIPWLLIYGFCSGVAVTLPAVILPYICPNLAVYGTRIGMLYFCSGLGFLISTPIATAANASTGSFLGSQLWTGFCSLGAGVFFFVTAFEVRKRRLLYELGRRRTRATERKLAV